MLGWIAFAGILGTIGLALGGLVYQAPTLSLSAVLAEGEIWRILRFTLWQAFLSCLLSIALAIPFARALARRQQFWGRNLLIRLSSLSLIIPTMVAVFGIATVHGRNGWLNQLLAAVGLEQGYSLYGINGILLAHIFFNLPLATRVLLNAIESLPSQTWRLASQLGLPPLSIFKYIEWPLIRSVIPGIAGLIFMLCFTSFAIVLALGGGPSASTLEVAIYQAIRFDYDIGRGVVLAFIQITVCLALVAVFNLARQNFSFQTGVHAAYHRPDSQDQLGKIIDFAVIIIIGIFLLSPLFAVIVRAISVDFFKVLGSTAFTQALFSSLVISLSAALLALTLSLPISFLYKNLACQGALKKAIFLDIGSALILVVPPLTLGMGLFLVLRSFASLFELGIYLVILINAILAVPFLIRILQPPIRASAQQVDRLSASLGITGWSLFKIVYWPLIRKPIAFALAIAATLSLGDMGVIALFGTQDLSTLPLLIYRLFGAYRMDEAAVVALFLCLLCFALFWSIERLLGGQDKHA